MRHLTKTNIARIKEMNEIYLVRMDTYLGGFKKIGYNAGVYGWNWDLYFDEENNIYYLQGYRNIPNISVKQPK